MTGAHIHDLIATALKNNNDDPNEAAFALGLPATWKARVRSSAGKPRFVFVALDGSRVESLAKLEAILGEVPEPLRTRTLPEVPQRDDHATVEGDGNIDAPAAGMEKFESAADLVAAALKKCNDNKEAAAVELGLPEGWKVILHVGKQRKVRFRDPGNNLVEGFQQLERSLGEIPVQLRKAISSWKSRKACIQSETALSMDAPAAKKAKTTKDDMHGASPKGHTQTSGARGGKLETEASTIASASASSTSSSLSSSPSSDDSDVDENSPSSHQVTATTTASLAKPNLVAKADEPPLKAIKTASAQPAASDIAPAPAAPDNASRTAPTTARGSCVWQKHMSPEYGIPYWWNSATEEAVWECPPGAPA